MSDYNIIIAGAGASGLSLAYHLNQNGLTDQRILLVDRERKTQNDRTFCFWERDANPFESILYRAWRKLEFHGENFSRTLAASPYSYKMLRGIDLYNFMDAWLAQQPNIERKFGEVNDIEETSEGANVCVDNRLFTANWVFNSIPHPIQKTSGAHFLLQHFLGWEIETNEACFDPDTATLMDFRVDQFDDTRFVYVLPFDARRALVEYTVFSPSLLPRDVYAHELTNYIRRVMHVSSHVTYHEEFGVIPMTNAKFETQPSPHIFNIGTVGGRAKPSSGYTFLRIQDQSKHFAKSMKETGAPIVQKSRPRFSLYDSVLLNILETQRVRGKRVFTDLFKRNPTPLIFKFLDEQTNLAEDLRVMSTVDLPKFSRAMLEELLQPARFV
jgi:lycopene beta-cyclase